MLGCLKLDIDSQRLRQPIGVVQQPGGEVVRLVQPDRPRVDLHQLAERYLMGRIYPLTCSPLVR